MLGERSAAPTQHGSALPGSVYDALDMDRPFLSLALLLLLAPATTRADSGTCRERYPTPAAEAAMFDVAWTTAERLDTLPDVDVVIAARGGQDLSRYGL